MKYLLSIYVNDQGWNEIEANLMEEFQAAHDSIQRDLTASGELVDTTELSPVDARQVRTNGGTPIVTDGPFTEGREVVGGFYIVDTATIERAVEIAGRFVEARFAPVEVRRMGH